MPIEGPLRELGIHDVFQLLDLSRKTGILRVTSELRSDSGLVYFDNGRVVHAEVRSKPSTIEDVLVESGKITAGDLDKARGLVAQHADGANVTDIFIEVGVITARELERLLKHRLESVVFEMMSWREGFFSFEERDISDVPDRSRIQVPTESLLMESARRIDEWSRIADKIPNVSVIPALAPVSDDHETQLDLLPHEWEVLTMIDGARDLKAIAAGMARSEFDIAKIAYGLATTGVIEIRQPGRLSAAIAALPAQDPAADAHMERGFAAARTGDLATASAAWEAFLKMAPSDPAAGRVKAALEAATQLRAAMEAHRRDR